MNALPATPPRQPDSTPTTPMPFDQKAFRHALGCFPTGVAVITTLDLEGRPTGLTCNSFSSVSLDPPLVLWSLRKSSKSIDTFRQTTAFAINVLAEDQDTISGHFANTHITEKFKDIPYETGSGGVPLIHDCVARFHCRTYQQHDAGDHIIFIGHVEQFERVREDDPLVFCKGAYMMVTQSLRELSAKGEAGPQALVEARRSVYIGMVRLACTHGSEDDFNAIESTLREMQQHIEAGDMLQRAKLAIRFFNQIAAAAHNRVMEVVAQSLTTLLQLSVNAHSKADQITTLYLPSLDPIRWTVLDSLRARDANAAESAIVKYLEQVALHKAETPLTH